MEEKLKLKHIENKLLRKYYKIKWGQEVIDPTLEHLLIEQITVIAQYQRKLEERDR